MPLPRPWRSRRWWARRRPWRGGIAGGCLCPRSGGPIAGMNRCRRLPRRGRRWVGTRREEGRSCGVVGKIVRPVSGRCKCKAGLRGTLLYWMRLFVSLGEFGAGCGGGIAEISNLEPKTAGITSPGSMLLSRELSSTCTLDSAASRLEAESAAFRQPPSQLPIPHPLPSTKYRTSSLAEDRLVQIGARHKDTPQRASDALHFSARRDCASLFTPSAVLRSSARQHHRNF